MTVKSIVKSFLQKTGYDLVRFSPELNRPFPVLPMLVSEKLKRGEPFYFVQVGANDGVLDDPLRELIYQHHFPGLLIEPLPDLFERLKTNYAGEHQLVYENVAILDREGPVEIHRIRSDADVPGHWHGIASFHRKNLLAQGVPPQFIEAQSVHGVPLHVLLARQVIVVTTLLFHRFAYRHTRDIDQQRADKHTPERNTHQTTSFVVSGNGASVGV